MQSMKDFCNKHNITCDLKRVDSNPLMNDQPMNHYKVTLHRNKYKKLEEHTRMTLIFSTGMGWKKDPEVEDVLNCIADDANFGKNMDFEEFCSDLGYDSDSRKAEKIFKACVKQYEKLCGFMNADQIEELLYETERL